MRYDLAKINSMIAPLGLSAEFVPAEDESVDDEIAIYVDDREAEAVAGIQFNETRTRCMAHCWTDSRRRAMHFGTTEHRDVMVALGDAVNLMHQYGWINAPLN